MMWWGGWWWPGIVIAFLFMMFCMGMMGRMMGHGMSGSHRHQSERRRRDVPEDILANRLASGEIDIEEYERLRETLRRTDTTAQS